LVQSAPPSSIAPLLLSRSIAPVHSGRRLTFGSNERPSVRTKSQSTISAPVPLALRYSLSSMAGAIQSSQSTKAMYSPEAASMPRFLAPPCLRLAFGSMMTMLGWRAWYSLRMPGLSSWLTSQTAITSMPSSVWASNESRHLRR